MVEQEKHPELSICISVKNRSKLTLADGKILYLFPHCIDALVQSIATTDSLEIVICDWHSTDWPLAEWLPERLAGLDYRIVPASGSFHRGAGRNQAAAEARGDILFFLDADMLANRAVIEKAFAYGRQGAVFFPHCFYFVDPGHHRGFWCSGKGNCALPRAVFYRSGQWPCPPAYRRHYDEDQFFFRRICRLNVPVIREQAAGFYHPYHPGKSIKSVMRLNQQHYIIELP